MLNINLVPEVKKEKVRIKKINLIMTTLAFAIGGTLLASVIILGSLLAYRSTRISAVDNKVAKIEGELVAYKDLEESVITLENGLADIKQIISGGRDWTDFYEEIEKAMPADTQFLTFKVVDNTVSADVKGRDVKSIDRFIKSFSDYKNSDGQNVYANVVVDGYNAKDDGEVSFQASFDVVGGVK